MAFDVNSRTSMVGVREITLDVTDQTVRHFALKRIADYVSTETAGQRRLDELKPLVGHQVGRLLTSDVIARIRYGRRESKQVYAMLN